MSELTDYKKMIAASHTRKTWGISLTERAKAVREIGQGGKFREVCKAYGLGSNQLSKYCEACGVHSRRKRSDPGKEKSILDSLAGGMTYSGTAKKFNMSERQIYRIAKKNNYKKENHEA